MVQPATYSQQHGGAEMTYVSIPINKRCRDIRGTVFNRLTAITPVGYDSRKNIVWLCICECGTETTAAYTSLRSNNTKSCGCLIIDKIKACSTTHGLSSTPEYGVWISMKDRIFRTTDKRHKNYGGRGIRMDKTWVDSFEAFITDMGRRPSDKHSIDRIDNDGDYCPENCRWVTIDIQARNKTTSRLLTYRGETKCLVDWADEFGIAASALGARLNTYGWSVSDALTKPKYHHIKESTNE